MPKIKVDVRAYTRERGITLSWQENSVIRVGLSNGGALIEANGPGLVSLAQHLLTLAQSEAPAGCHIHYDEWNALEEGSIELIVDKISD